MKKIVFIQYFPHNIQKVRKDIEYVMHTVSMPLDVMQRMYRAKKILEAGRIKTIEKEDKHVLDSRKLARVDSSSISMPKTS